MYVCISTDLYTKIFKRRNCLQSRVKYKQISSGAIYHKDKSLVFNRKSSRQSHNNVSSLIQPFFYPFNIYINYKSEGTRRERGTVICRRIQYRRSVHRGTQKATDCYPAGRYANAGVTLICLTDQVPS
jgi:hypothetical protein